MGTDKNLLEIIARLQPRTTRSSMLSNPSYRRMGHGMGQTKRAAEKRPKKFGKQGKPLISCKISGDLVAGAGFEPTTFGL